MKNTAIVLSVLAALFAGCLAAPEPVGSSAAPLLADGEPCSSDAECAPTAKICAAAACINGECGAVILPAGAPCSTGVGVCDSAGACNKVAGTCKGWDQWTEASIIECIDDDECIDKSSCTSDTCVNGYCVNAPLKNGSTCLYPWMNCKNGLCCMNE